MIDIHYIMEKLSKERPIFFSESDFKHALAWIINNEHPDFNIRLEKRIEFNDKTEIYIDLILEKDNLVIPIEMKYKTRTFAHSINREFYKLKNHGAADVNRYRFLADISRIEKFIQEKSTSKLGYAILLTNEHLYWRKGRIETIDDQFKIHEKRILKGELRWDAKAAPRTIEGNAVPIKLIGEYEVKWNNYFDFKKLNGIFKYLVLEVSNV